VTGNKLLQKGELKRRYTIIPLNKISAKTLSQSVISTAKTLVRGASAHHHGPPSRGGLALLSTDPPPRLVYDVWMWLLSLSGCKQDATIHSIAVS